MRIGFIGAGKVGTAFGIYLSGKGVQIQGYYSKTAESAKKAAKYTSSNVYSSCESLGMDCDCIFITTVDSQIRQVCEQLAASGALTKDKAVAHMSGALPSTLLEAAQQKGCSTFSMHPMQAFADIEKAAEDLENTYFSIEGSADGLHSAEQLLKITGNRCFKLSPADKTLYHAAACMFSNYLVTLMDKGLTLLDTVGIDRKEGFEAMEPLILGTLENIKLLGCENALTGPIVRGDGDTVAKHLKELHTKSPHILELYSNLGVSTLELAARSRLQNENKVKDLKDILKDPENNKTERCE